MNLNENNLYPLPTVEQSIALPGLEKVNRYWDKKHGVWGAKIKPGEFYVTLNNELIYTVLGSCISACVRDKQLGIGGMNHFMLPASSTESIWGEANRYGNFAMENLINEILKSGGKRKNLEAKLFGGGKILENMTNVGAKNIEFARDYLQTESIELVSENVGDVIPRKVIYFPETGNVLMKRLNKISKDKVVNKEYEYMKNLDTKPVQSDIELF